MSNSLSIKKLIFWSGMLEDNKNLGIYGPIIFKTPKDSYMLWIVQINRDYNYQQVN